MLLNSQSTDQLERIDLDEELLAQVLELPLFSKLTKSLRNSMAQFAKLVRVPAGTEFVQQREFSSDFSVVLSGLVSAYRTEEDGETRLLDQLGASDWFGEVSALSNQPSLAKLKADLPCSLLVLEGALFKEIYMVSKHFKRMIDERYQERSLGLHLAVVPSLRNLDRDAIKRLRGHVEFKTFDAKALIAKQGEPVDALYLVRAGAVTVHRVDTDGSELLEGYLRESSSFGESAMMDQATVWQGDHRALTRTELLVLSGAEIRNAFAESPEILEGLALAARKVALADQGLDEDSAADQLEIMVHRQSAKGGEALVIDLDKCVRCNGCVESCVAVHEDGVSRLSKKGNRVPAEANNLGSPISMITACYHCQTPGCMMACGFGAIRRDPQGMIRFIWDNCVGCADCVKGCPYDVIRLTSPPEEQDDRSLLEKIPLLGGLFKKVEPFRLGRDQSQGFHRDKKVEGKAVKCDRCEGLPFEACVYNCPCGAIERRAPQDLFEGLREQARSGQ